MTQSNLTYNGLDWNLSFVFLHILETEFFFFFSILLFSFVLMLMLLHLEPCEFHTLNQLNVTDSYHPLDELEI